MHRLTMTIGINVGEDIQVVTVSGEICRIYLSKFGISVFVYLLSREVTLCVINDCKQTKSSGASIESRGEEISILASQGNRVLQYYLYVSSASQGLSSNRILAGILLSSVSKLKGSYKIKIVFKYVIRVSFFSWTYLIYIYLFKI